MLDLETKDHIFLEEREPSCLGQTFLHIRKIKSVEWAIGVDEGVILVFCVPLSRHALIENQDVGDVRWMLGTLIE